jgi:spore coat protein U-like protein
MTRRLVLAALILLACSVRAMATAGTCDLKGTAAINYGTFVGFSTSAVTGSITVHCTANANYDVGLDAGTAPGATVTSRAMTDGKGHWLGYQLFQDAAHTTNWGNTVGVDTVPKSVANGQSPPFSIYGLLPANEYAPQGTYTDSVNVIMYSNGVSVGTAVLTITVILQTACAINASNLNFGAYTGAVVNATSALTVQCTSGTAYNVGLDPGQTSGATVTTRQMVNGSNKLNYTLYSDSGRTTNWGNTVGTDTVAGTGSGATQSLTVYGRITAGQSPPPGSYTDTITATLTY